MALRFQKRIKIAPGIKLNVSAKGVSTTVGARGASVNVGKKGVYANTGIPGTGLSSRTKIGGGKKAAPKAPPSPPEELSAGSKFFMWVGILAIVGFIVWMVA